MSATETLGTITLEPNDGNTRPIPRARNTHLGSPLERAMVFIRYNLSVWSIVFVLGVLCPLGAMFGFLYAIDDLHYYHGGGIHGVVAGPDCGPNVDIEWGGGTIAFTANACS